LCLSFRRSDGLSGTGATAELARFAD
jgi:hypothetical protein